MFASNLQDVRTFYFFLLLLCPFSLWAQSGSGWLWTSTSGQSTNASGKAVRDVRFDAAGNVYAAGDFMGSMTLGSSTLSTQGDGSVSNNFDRDAFVVKYDASGNVVWAHSAGTPAIGSNQNGSVVAVDASGNVYLGGSGLNSGGSLGNGFVVKYDANGNFQWQRIFNYYDINSINIDPSGNPIVAESDGGHRAAHKLDPATGASLWQFTVTNAGSNGGSLYHDLLDANGNAYFTCFTLSATTVNVNGVNYVVSGVASFVISVDNNGAVRWVDQINNVQIQLGLNIDAANGNVYLQMSGGSGSSFQGVTVGAGAGANSFVVLNTNGAISSYAQLSPYKTGKLLITANAIYQFHILGGSAFGTGTETYGNYFIANRSVAGQDLGVITKYDKATNAPLWMNSFEINGSGTTAVLTLDVSSTGKAAVGGYYETSARFGANTYTPVVGPGSYPHTDFYVSVFDGSNIAPQATTTWTGAAGNSSWIDPLNWTNGIPNQSNIAIINSGASTYPATITAGNLAGQLQIAAGVTINLPLNFKAGAGIINHGAIEVTESGTFYGGFNSGNTLISGSGKVVIKSTGVQPFWYVPLNNSLEINVSGTVTGLSNGAPINGSLIFTNGIYDGVYGTLVMGNPNATVSYTTASHMTGSLQRAVNSTGSYTFPVGTATNLEAATIDLNGTAGFSNITVSFSTSAPGAVSTAAVGVPVNAALTGGFWTITPNAGMTSGSYGVTLYERGATNTALDPTRYVVIKRPNTAGSWAFLGQNLGGTQSGGTATAAVFGLTSFSDFAIGIATSSVNSALPLKLLAFSATEKSGAVTLQWITTNEVDCDRFDIERSPDGRDYTRIGSRTALNTGNETAYSFIDPAALASVSYYRLKQWDRDGRFTYSPVVMVKKGADQGYALWPNPASGAWIQLQVPAGELRQSYTIRTYGGTVVVQGRVQDRNQLISIHNLPAGPYLIQLASGKTIPFLRL